MGKGEIAHYEQFLLFQKCFQKACFPGASKGVLCGNGLILCKIILYLTLPNNKFLDWSKLKGFAEDKINAQQILF